MAGHLNNISKTDPQFGYNWFKIVERLGWLQKYFTNNKNIYSNSLIKYILSKIKNFLGNLDEKPIFEQGLTNLEYHPDSNRDSVISTSAAAKKFLIEKLMEGNIGNFFENKSGAINESLPLTFLIDPAIVQKEVQVVKQRDENKLKDVLRTIFRREKRDFKNEDERLSYNLQQLISSIKLSPEAQRFTFGEYLQKVDTYYNRGDKFEYTHRII